MANNRSGTLKAQLASGERVLYKRLDPADFDIFRRLLQGHPDGITFDMNGLQPRPMSDEEIPSSSQAYNPTPGRSTTQVPFPSNLESIWSPSNPVPHQGLSNRLSDAFLQHRLREFRSSSLSSGETIERTIPQITSNQAENVEAEEGCDEHGQFLGATNERQNTRQNA